MPSDGRVLRATYAEIRVGEAPIGMVLDVDIDRTVTQRWDQVRGKLSPLGFTLPDHVDPEGCIGAYQDGAVRFPVGVWLMPNNRREGGIEAFLADLAGTSDLVWTYAKACTRKLIEDGNNRFTLARQSKAEIRSFLAWQEDPGCSCGVAMSKKYFDGNSPNSRAFVDWFSKLFGAPNSG